MRMRAAASCFALPILVVATLTVATAPAAAKAVKPVNAPNAPGAVHLGKGAFKRVGKEIVCGRVGGRWVPGTRRMSFWFFSHTQRARNLQAAARHHRGAVRALDLRLAKAYRHRAKIETPACGPLRFRLKGASGVAVHGIAKPRAGHLSNLQAITPRGKVRAAITSGSANVSKIYQAPNGKVYVLFTTTTQIGGGEPTGNKICDDQGTADDESELRAAGDGEDEDTADDEGDDTGDNEDSSDDAPVCEDELTPIIYCLLAELDDKGEPTCVDTSLYSVRGNWLRGQNDPIQFDDQGAIYFASASAPGGSFIKRYLNGKLTGYASDANMLIDDYLVLGNGDVLLTGATLSTGARWVRRVDLEGHMSSVRSVSANFMRLFGDGNAYLGFSSGGDFGVRRYLPATNTFDTKFWISGTRENKTPPADNDISTACENADQGLRDAYCQWFGSRIMGSATTTDKKVYVIAGTADGGRLMQYWPEVRVVPSTVQQISLATPVGDKIAIAGVDASEHRVLVLHDTATDTETPLIGPDAEFDVYHLTYDEKNNKLLLDGLRFSDSKFVLGQVDLATNAVSFPATSTTRWTSVTALR